ncbi:MAG: GyaR protein [Clostridiales bacterium]|nr:GyaR protein [Clostridiales bacterium]
MKKCNERGIAICNNKGANDTAVAEDALLLMLGCLKSIITGHQCVYDGRQIEVKQASFGVIKELSRCTVGLVGFGDIAKATTKFANALGARIIYTNRTRYAELEEKYNVSYADMDTLLAQSDFVSLHIAVTDDTRGMVNSDFLGKMKPDAYLINTSRGDLVDNSALLNALLENKIAGAGLDVISPEPVAKINILLDERIKDKLVLTPHIAGITNLTVEKIYKKIYENITNYANNQPLTNRVN